MVEDFLFIIVPILNISMSQKNKKKITNNNQIIFGSVDIPLLSGLCRPKININRAEKIIFHSVILSLQRPFFLLIPILYCTRENNYVTIK